MAENMANKRKADLNDVKQLIRQLDEKKAFKN